LLSLVAGTTLFGALAWADPSSQVGRLSLIEGPVSFCPGSLDEWAPAALNYPLSAGDNLWMDSLARAEIQLGSAAIRLGQETEFSFLSLDDQTVQLRLSQGSLYVDLWTVDQGSSFEIDTPNAVVSLPTAGRYRVDVSPSGDTSVAVRAGLAEVTAGGYARDLPAGQSTVISGTDSISYTGMANPQPDAWDSWCAERDGQAERAASNAYVSREMIGADDLEANGAWVATADYGRAWAPSSMRVDWAPYRFGRWAWVGPWGWTWIDEAPWGFAPFHYGRWAYIGARWLWLPGALNARPVYAPALVVFVGGSGWTPGGGDGIGWFPLGPREIYVPPYQASVDYVLRINVTQVTVINVQIIQTYDVNRTVYINRNAPRAITIVPRIDFAQSRSAGSSVVAMSQADISRAPMMGMTAKVAPQRESVIARPSAATGPVRQPPATLKTRQVFSRVAPPPAQISFAVEQKALAANPGRPVDPAALSAMQRAQKAPAPLVKVVKPSVIRKESMALPIAQAQPLAPTPAPAQNPERPKDPAQLSRQVQPGIKQAASNAGARAASMIATVRGQTLPNADRQVAAARKVPGIRVDLNAMDKELTSAKQSLEGANRDMAAKNFDRALQEAVAIKGQVDALMSQLVAAMKSAT